MVNCNPETVSTDYDTADRLYFEPLTAEDVLEVVEREQPIGVVVQFGGQTPLKLARRLVEHGVPILGTSPAAIDLAEDRERFGDLLAELGLRAPDWAIAGDADEAVAAAERIGYPVLVRPSYVLGGRAMRVCYSADDVRSAPVAPNTLVDRFVEDAIEVDVDAVGDGTDAIVAAVMEHVEEAGVHSGDSACVIPPLSIGPELEAEIRRQTELLVRGLGVQGLCNVQFALHEGTIYVLEANPRASRTVPFVCKAMGIDLVDLACRVTTGSKLAEMNVAHPRAARRRRQGGRAPVRALPRLRSRCSGPEMRSTGEVMALAPDFATTYAKAMRAAGLLPAASGRTATAAVAFLSVCDRDKPAATLLAQRLADLGFDLVATPGTARRIAQLGIEVTEVAKVGAADGNSVVDLVRSGKVDLIVNTPVGRGARADGYQIRRAAISAQGALHHDARRRQRGGAGDRARLGGRAQEPAGAARLTPLARGGLRAARAVRAGPARAHVRRRRARAVPHAARARARLVPGAAALGGGLRRRRRHVPLPAARPGARGARRRSAPRWRCSARSAMASTPQPPGAAPAARRRRVRRRAARAARAALPAARAARGLPRRRTRRAPPSSCRRQSARSRCRPPTCSTCWRARLAGRIQRLRRRARRPRARRRRGLRGARACPARSRSRRRWPAATAPATAARCASAVELVRLCVEGPVVAGERGWRRERRSRDARRDARARASGDERVGHARPARRARRRARDRPRARAASSPRP